MAEDIYRKTAREFLNSRIGKKLWKGVSKALEETVDEVEETVRDFTNTKLKKHTDKIKDALKGDEEDAEKENTEDSE